MDAIKRILAVIDPTKEQQHSLSRSIDLAKKSGATITAFLSIYDFSYEMTTMLSADEREAMREAVIKDRQEWLNEQMTFKEMLASIGKSDLIKLASNIRNKN